MLEQRRRAGADRRRDRPPRGLLAGGRRRPRDVHRGRPRRRHRARSSRARGTPSTWSAAAARRRRVGGERRPGAAAGERAAAARAALRAERRAGARSRRCSASTRRRARWSSTARSASASWRPAAPPRASARSRAPARRRRPHAGVPVATAAPDWYAPPGSLDPGPAHDRPEGDHGQSGRAAVAPLRLPQLRALIEEASPDVPVLDVLDPAYLALAK